MFAEGKCNLQGNRIRIETPIYGDTRTRTFFAFIPITAEIHNSGGRKECRWLERVTVVYWFNGYKWTPHYFRD